MRFVGLVLKNLMRSKRRTRLTIMSISVSFFIFSVVVSVPSLVNQFLADKASSVRIITHNRASRDYPLPSRYNRPVMNLPHVVAVVRESWFGGIYHDVTDQFPNLAVDPDQIDTMWDDRALSKETLDRFQHLRTACIVAVGTMKRFNLRVGQQVQLKGTIYPFNVTLNIVGIMNNRAIPELLIFRRDYLEEAAGRPGLVSRLWVRVDKAENVPRAMTSIDQLFTNSSAETQSESEAVFLRVCLEAFAPFSRLPSYSQFWS